MMRYGGGLGTGETEHSGCGAWLGWSPELCRRQYLGAEDKDNDQDFTVCCQLLNQDGIPGAHLHLVSTECEQRSDQGQGHSLPIRRLYFWRWKNFLPSSQPNDSYTSNGFSSGETMELDLFLPIHNPSTPGRGEERRGGEEEEETMQVATLSSHCLFPAFALKGRAEQEAKNSCVAGHLNCVPRA